MGVLVMSAEWKNREVELPELDIPVLVATRIGDVVPAILVKLSTEPFFCDYDSEGHLTDEDVTHWMPFPEPP
jgi:hypothetical protein